MEESLTMNKTMRALSDMQKHSARRAAMLLTMLTVAFTAWALDPRPMAVYCNANKTLYLTYGDPDVVTPDKADQSCRTFTPEGTNQVLDVTYSWGGDATVIPPDDRIPSWSSEVYGSVSTVVIESSFAVVRPTSTYSWFAGFTALSSIQGMENLNTSEVTIMSGMFSTCYALSTLDLSFFDTSKVTNMDNMFINCYNLVSIYIGDGWNTSSVTSSDKMFFQCNSIVGDDGTTFQQNNWLSSWDKTHAHANAGGYMRRYPPINLSDGSDNTATLSKAIADKEYRAIINGRTIYCDGDWNTLCLPFNVSDLTGTPLEGFTVKELDTETAYNGHLTGMDGSTLYLNFRDATSITAGVPYIVKKVAVKDGATTPTYYATAGTAGSASVQGYANLVDGNTDGYRWRTSSVPAYCEFQSDLPVRVTGYTLTTGNQSIDYDPRVWTLSVSADGNEPWTVIDSRNANENSGDALPSGRTATSDMYAVQKPGTYQYFRFDVTATTNGSIMCLSELTLQACYPFDIANIETPMFKPVTISSTAPTDVTFSGGKFCGTYDPTEIYDDGHTRYYLGAQNTLYYPTDEHFTVKAFRAYFQLTDPNVNASAIVLNFGDGETTGIGSIDNGELRIDNDDWYSLDGRRLSGKPTQRGIYIHNGKKVLVGDKR